MQSRPPHVTEEIGISTAYTNSYLPVFPLNMRSFLGMLMVLSVSGDDTTVKGVSGDTVLLPCHCSGQNVANLKWQWNDKMVVFPPNQTLDRYTGRTKTFLSEKRNNCSILIANITPADQGNYKCILKGAEYYYSYVYLNVSASYSVCRKEEELSGGVKVFRCEVKGSYGEARIQWTLDGQLLTNSATTNISHNNHPDAGTGIYNFYSQLGTNLNWTSKPTCDVKANNVSTTLTDGCDGSARERNRGISERMRSVKVLPIMLALGLSLY